MQQMTSEAVERALARGRSLLRPERAGPLIETSPEDPPHSLGALAGIGFQTPDAAVRLSVYVIPGADNQGLAAGRLRERHPTQPGMSSKITSNGPMLFFGHTGERVTDESARGSNGIPPEDRLARIVSAFAGDE